MSFLALFESVSTLQVLLLAILFLLALVYLNPVQAPYNDFPRVPRPWVPMPWHKSLDQSLQDGYEQFTKQGQPFVIKWWALDNLVLPPKYLNDVRKADFQHVSFFKNMADALHLHTWAGDLFEDPSRQTHSITRGVNPQLPRMTPIIAEEADRAFEDIVGDIKEGWAVFKAIDVFFPMTHQVSCRFLMTKRLSRNKEFLKIVSSFKMSLFVTALIIKLLPLGMLRGAAAWPLTFFHRRKVDQVVATLQPEVEARIDEDNQRLESGQPSPYDDALQWILSEPVENIARNRDPRRISLEMLINLWAGGDTPGVIVTFMLYQALMDHERWIEPMRQEVAQAVSEYGWTDQAIQRLPLQDSFIRELARLKPIISLACPRTVKHTPWVLSDGLTLPVGTRIMFPAKPIAHDPEKFENPLEFDGFRFAKLAAKHGTAGDAGNKYSAAHTSSDNLMFGYGAHTCPGRFYALREVKIMFSKLVLNYEVKWAAPQTELPAPFEIEGQFAPNMTAKIALKPREDRVDV